MKPFVFTVLALAIFTFGCTATKTAVAPSAQAGPAGFMERMVRVNGCAMTLDSDGVRLSSPVPDRALVQTAAGFRAPFTVKLRAQTDSTNLRLYWNAGMVIFNWECGQEELRVHDPLTNRTTALPGKGWIEPGQWHDVVWDVRPDGMSITVDDELRFSAPGNYADIDAAVGIGPAFGSVVTVESFEVTQP